MPNNREQLKQNQHYVGEDKILTWKIQMAKLTGNSKTNPLLERKYNE